MKSPEQKAIDLIGSMCFNDCTDEGIDKAIPYALVAVQELKKNSRKKTLNDYWIEVENEILKLKS